MPTLIFIILISYRVQQMLFYNINFAASLLSSQDREKSLKEQLEEAKKETMQQEQHYLALTAAAEQRNKKLQVIIFQLYVYYVLCMHTKLIFMLYVIMYEYVTNQKREWN